VVGESLAVHVGRRLGMDEHDVDVLGAMVRHHLLLPHTATRRDLEDPRTVTRVVETLAGDALVLDLLEALAEADALATGPGVWSPWKATLIRGLAERCRVVMSGEPLPVPAQRSVLGAELAAAVAAGSGPQVRWAAGAEPATVVVAVPERPDALSASAGVLALHSLEVHAAALFGADVDTEDATGRVVVFEFAVSPRFGGVPDPALLRADLVRVLDGAFALDEALARKERDYAPIAATGEPPPPRVLWFDDEAAGAVVLELRGTDRIGLLHRVAAALEGCKVELRWARVATLGSSVVDAFCIAGPGGSGALSVTERRQIEDVVLAATRK
jgi:[protein-PII] uridylyltransferase